MFRCEGECKNMLMCTLTGGVISETGGEHCRGLLSVCCFDRNRFYKSRTNHFHRSRVSLPPELVRIPRQLNLDKRPSSAKGGRGKVSPGDRQPRFISGSKYEDDKIYNTKFNLTSKQFKSSDFKQTHQIVPQNSKNKYKPELETNFIPDTTTDNYFDCGLSRHVSNVAQRRILGGQEAGYGQFPWTALIQITSHVGNLDKMCAGTLINNR